MKIDTHGLKMVGLKKASGETKYHVRGTYTQISYDTRDGEILTKYHTENSWSEYHSKAIIHVCNALGPCTMQEIADLIAIAMLQDVGRKN